MNKTCKSEPPRVAAVFVPMFIIALNGCATQQTTNEQWSQHADAIAKQRIAYHHAPSHHNAPSEPPRVAAVNTAFTEGGSDHPSNVKELNHLQLADADADTSEMNDQESKKSPETQRAQVERGPLPNFFDTVERDIKDAPHQLLHDTKKVFLNPWNVLFLVGAGGASLALRPEVDDDIEDFYHPNNHDYKHTFSKPFRNFLDAGGNPGTGFIVAGTWYLGGQILQDAKTYEVGKRLASTLIITDMSTLLLKVCAADTKAPNGQRYAWPSGHTSSTVALATVLNDAYGPVVGVPMYGFAAFMAMERLDDREHKFSDVIFGAALGWVVAETVMKEHRPEICGGEIVPYVDPENSNAGVAWTKTLGN